MISNDQVSALNGLESRALLSWAWEQFGLRAAIFTSFQNTGCVMIDMARGISPDMRIIAIDTLRLPNETYELMERLSRRYGMSIERFAPDPERIEQMVQEHGEFLFFDSKEKQELCCRTRKVEPNNRALETVDVWITGLRRDQSSGRAVTPKAALVEINGRPILKLCPLADWSEDQVWDYIRQHDVPYNRLYDQGYVSIGCTICSTPIRLGEDKRAGRWRWMNQLSEKHHKECGLHISGSGI